MQVEVAHSSGLLDTDVPAEQKLYGYHRLADPLVWNEFRPSAELLYIRLGKQHWVYDIGYMAFELACGRCHLRNTIWSGSRGLILGKDSLEAPNVTRMTAALYSHPLRAV